MKKLLILLLLCFPAFGQATNPTRHNEAAIGNGFDNGIDSLGLDIDKDGKIWSNSGAQLGAQLVLKEQAAAIANVATYGQIWVKNDAPNTLWFTDDANTDVQLGLVTSIDDLLGTANEITVTNGTDAIIGGDVTIDLPASVTITTALDVPTITSPNDLTFIPVGEDITMHADLFLHATTAQGGNIKLNLISDDGESGDPTLILDSADTNGKWEVFSDNSEGGEFEIYNTDLALSRFSIDEDSGAITISDDLNVDGGDISAVSAAGSPSVSLDGVATGTTLLRFKVGGANDWYMGYLDTADEFRLYNYDLAQIAWWVNGATNKFTLLDDLEVSGGDITSSGTLTITPTTTTVNVDADIHARATAGDAGAISISVESDTGETGDPQFIIDTGDTNGEWHLFADNSSGEDLYLYNTDNARYDLSIQGPTGDVGMGIATPDGPLHVWTGTAGVVTANSVVNDLVLENSDHTGISILAPDTKAASLYFGEGTVNATGFIAWDGASDALILGANVSGGIVEIGVDTNNLALTFQADTDAEFEGDIDIAGGDITVPVGLTITTGSTTDPVIFATQNVAMNRISGVAAQRGLQLSSSSGLYNAIYFNRDDNTIDNLNDIGALHFTGNDTQSGDDKVGATIQVDAAGTWGASDSSARIDFKVTPSGVLNTVSTVFSLEHGGSDSIIMMYDLPPSDPSNAGQLWNNSGVLTVSAG